MNNEQQTLVMRLQEAGLDTRRFLKLNAEKAAFEDDWPNKLYTPAEMGDHPYWGICGRDGLVLVDADKVTMESELRKVLPPTFEVRSPRRGLTHFYIVVEGEPVQNKTLHLKGEEEGSGEIRAQNYYLVAAGTEIHYRDLRTSEPKIGRYIIAQDRPFAKIQYADFMKAIEPYLGKDSTQKITFEHMRQGVPQGTRHAMGIRFADYLIGIQKFDYDTALVEMQRWNQLNQPPMDDVDLKRMVENALGYIATHPREEDIGDPDKLTQLATDPKLEKRFLDDANHTVKHDNHVVLSTFHAGLSAYADPYNVALKAISGAGKSYGTTETTAYFPESDVVMIGSQSPKVVSHDYGELMTGNDEPLDLEDTPLKPKRRDYEDKNEYLSALDSYKAQKKVWDKKIRGSYHLIRLDGKIYHFLETISQETFQMFKSTLSHDAKRIPHKYVDDRGKVHVTVLEGSPAAIFNSVDQAYLEEFATRTFTATPNTSKVKIGAANELSNRKKSYPFDYEEATQEKKLLKALISRIRDTMKEYKLKIINPFLNLHELFSSDVTRDMRDFQHFLQMLDTYPIFYLFQRPIITIGKQRYLVITIEDVVKAKSLFDEIAETTKTGTDKKILDFYHKYIQKLKEGAVLEKILEVVNQDEEYKKNPMGDSTARFYLKRLNRLSWVQIKNGEVVTDRRKQTFYPLKDVDKRETQQKLSESSLKEQVELDLKAKLQIGFETWLQTSSLEMPLHHTEIIKIGDKSLESITLEQFKQIIVGGTPPSALLVSGPEETVKPETKLETTSKQEIKLVPLNSPPEGLEENLVAAHCKKWHTGACSFPGDPNCVTPLNTCAKTCPDYEEDRKQ